MTIRSQLSSKKRRAMIIAYSGLAFFILGMIISDKTGGLPVVPFVGFVVFFVSLMYLMWGVRCPNCKGNLGYLAMYCGTPFSVSNKIKYCWFCGIDIDTELKDQSMV
jgi:hypothetical protein